METDQNENSPRKLLRSRDDRVIGGVAGGLGRYFEARPDPVRIGFVALAFLGGAGILLYLAGLLLVPSETGPGEAPTRGRPLRPRDRGCGGAAGRRRPFLIGGGIFVAAVLVPLSALAIAGVLVWWLVSGEGPSGEPRDIALRAALGVGILILSGALAIGGAAPRPRAGARSSP